MNILLKIQQYVIAESKAPPLTDRPPLKGGALILARLVWVGLTCFTLGLFIFGLPLQFIDLNQEFTQAASDLARFGLSVKFLTGYAVILNVVSIFIFAGAAFLIFWHKSDDWLAMFVSITLLLFGVVNTGVVYKIPIFYPAFDILANFLPSLGLGTFFVFLCIFPDGRFIPSWMRWVAIFWVCWALTWPFVPAINPEQWSPVYSFIIYSLAFGLAGGFQITRYRCHYTALQRQQLRWAHFGLVTTFLAFFIYFIPHVITPFFFDLTPIGELVLGILTITIHQPLMILLPLTVTVSILHYRLWDIDPVINRTLVYGSITAFLSVTYFMLVILTQQIFVFITNKTSDIMVISSTLLIAALFQPLRTRLQTFIDRTFYRERIDFQQTFLQFSRQLRTVIDLPELLHLLVTRIADVLHSKYGAVFLYSKNNTFELAETQNISSKQVKHFSPKFYSLQRLHAGASVFNPKDELFPLLVPLMIPKPEKSILIGILALGPRLSEQNYSTADRSLLKELADQVGTSIYVAKLIYQKQAETRRKEEVERRLMAHRNSPVGKAEQVAEDLMLEPEQALGRLHVLAQQAGQDPESAQLINNLPKVLQGEKTKQIATLAEGYNYIFTSRFAPEVLPVGLRKLVAQLASPEVNQWPGAVKSLMIYRLAQKALAANTVPQISQLLSRLEEKKRHPPSHDPAKPLIPDWLTGIVHIFMQLHTVSKALHAYERVDTSQDKLAYLANAVYQLRRVSYLARTDLEGIDQILVLRITENWLAVITEAMSDLQTRAQIVCKLLTRHTWQGEIISLALNLHNKGRGTALNVKVSLAPTSLYTPLDDGDQIECLPAGEEAQATVRVRPKLEEGVDQFRVRFIIRYTDPRGPDQIEHFADVVYLLKATGEFQFIPNPYVVGTPLQTGSPLFVGREQTIQSIKDNLMANHCNNLVLIGQRRTGKTSVLKQLPAQLDDTYLPVYIDGQTLGLDPGLPNFFLSMATEIAFAVEDCGCYVDLPELEDFTESPASAFEHKFLSKVRKAIGDRHILILLDEFEELESAVKRGNLEPSVFGFMRHMIQHTPNLSVIFCGTHRLEELAGNYWSILFNISLYRHITFLSKSNAKRLVQEPVEKYGMRYDDLALDKMWRVTAGHPYFLQLLCHSLVNHHNKTERTYITVADVNTALDDILASGEAHFVYLWMEASTEERMVLVALSRMMPLTGQATAIQITDYLVERNITIDRWAVGKALHHLTLRDILKTSSQNNGDLDETYRWQLGLLGLWVERYKSLSRVVDKVVA